MPIEKRERGPIIEGERMEDEEPNENGQNGMMMMVESDEVERLMFVNAEDGLNMEAMDEENDNARQLERERLQLRILEGELDLEGLNLEDLINDDEFPTNLIVTGFQSEFFDDDTLRQRFEGLFQLYGEDATFHYFRSFKRARVTYSSAASAIQARIKMHMSSLGDNLLKCYFGQTAVKRKDSDGLLHPPTPDKQFLISPPASPPVGWEPMPESHPTINYDLVSAITKLKPGETHELHKPERESHPSIVVHVVGDETDLTPAVELISPESDIKPKMKIIQTRRPEV